ncbi:MAG: AarF/ABC1/UbiB kinase family protein, partial [Planctomycetaceae bacterium]|nr:AarF/ABC1/UbiB kinase family protein [Planctomycetaceae bacterium]
HPGNMRIFSNGRICLLDYGLIGHVEEYKRDLLVDLFLSVSKRDVARAVEVVLELGQNFQPVDRVLLQSDLRDFIENYYGIPLERIAVGSLLTDFVKILSNHSIRYPSELMLWIRAVITLEGIGRTLDPEFNLAQYLAPFIEKIVRQRYDLRHLVYEWTGEIRQILSAIHRMPTQIDATLKKINTDSIKFQLEHRNLDHLVTELDRSGNRIVIGMVMSSLILASSIVIRTTPAAGWLTIPTFLLSSLLGIWLIYGIFRSGRL